MNTEKTRTFLVRRRIAGGVLAYLLSSILLAVFLGEAAFHPQRAAIDSAAAIRRADRIGASLQEVAIASTDGTQLRGWFLRPAHPNGDAAILLHGVGDSRQGMLGLAEMCLDRGYSVLLPDCRGHGLSGGVPSYGVREADDVALWGEWLRSHAKPACLFGLGQSMGASILLQATGKLPFRAVVAEAPFSGFRQIGYIRVGQFFGTGAWLGKIVLRPAVELAFLYGRMRYGVWLPDASPETAAASNRVPILLIHGLADTNIPVGESEKISARNPGCILLWRVPHAGHCGARGAAGAEFDRRVLEWFDSHRPVPGIAGGHPL
jgi:uncharacterized protein